MEKERRTKALLLSTLVVVVATLSIAFAAMSRTLSINGIGKMDTASWSVYFDNLSDAIADGAKEEGKPNINAIDKGIIENINVKLFNPGDEISYKVDIVNDGTIDAEITMIKDIELTEVQKKVFLFKVTYTATGEVLKDGDVLPAGDTKNITINIKFRDDITEFDLPTENQVINLSYQITYTQYDGGNSDLPIGPNGGGVATQKAVLAHDAGALMSSSNPMEESLFNSTDITRMQVESITFLNSNVVPSEYQGNSWDASDKKDRSVMAWHTPGDTDGLFKVYIGGNGGVAAPEDSTALFAMFANLKTINFNNNFDTANVTSMQLMFAVCGNLSNLNLENFSTTNVTNMYGTFMGCSSLTSLDLSSFDVTNVTTMQEMFSGCSSLISLDLSNFKTSKVTNMNNTFNYCSALTNLDLSNFETPMLDNIGSLFSSSNVTNLTVDLRSADFSKITQYNGIFENANASNFTIIVSEEQKTLATTIFVGANIKTPSEL